MARKNIVEPLQITLDGDLTAATVTSTSTDIKHLDGGAYFISYTSLTGTGSFTVEGSVWTGSPIGTRLWATLDLDAIAIDSAVASSGTFIINLNGLQFEKLRLKYTKGTASAGVFQVWLMAKTVGA